MKGEKKERREKREREERGSGEGEKGERREENFDARVFRRPKPEYIAFRVFFRKIFVFILSHIFV